VDDMKKKFPSQIRYQENNPNTTFRTTKEEREKIIQMSEKSGKSISELVRIGLLNLQKDFSVAYNNGLEEGKKSGISKSYNDGYDAGYSKGSNEWAIWVECHKCYKKLYIKPNTTEHKRIIDNMKGYLKHNQCPQDTQ
jgi:flagellar biosynthesis/type III secretory pathway protein FliH